MNDTMKLLNACAREIARRNLKLDPEYRSYQRELEQQEHDFRARHGRNGALISEVNDLSDARNMVRIHESEFLFFLGLQMGLEVGKIDLLGEEAP